MINPQIKNWNYDKDLDGLLLFAQLIEEMLFDYTIDSYKVPALNTHSLCNELLDTIHEVKNGYIHQNSLKPIKEELVWSLNNDPVAKTILGNNYRIIIDNLDQSDSHLILYPYLEILKNILETRYFEEMQVQLKDEIKSSKNKNNITILTRQFVTELLNSGFSQQYIYYETKNYFFSNNKISSTDQIGKFLEKFILKGKKWEVVFRGQSHFNYVKKIGLNPEIIITTKKPKNKTISLKESRYLSDNENYPTFIVFKNIEALDPYQARDIAERYLQVIHNLASYNIHKERLSWDEKALVYSSNNHFTVVEYPVSPINKIRDFNIPELGSIVNSVSTFSVLQDYYLIFNSFDLHLSSIKAKSRENQLLNLWTSLESLLPPPREQRISHFIEAFEPLLSREYIQKLTRDLLHNLRLCLGDELDNIFSKLPEEYSEFEKCAALISMKKDNEALRDEIYSKIDQNILLRNRIYILMNKLNSSENIYHTIETHKKRIVWHIQRIYRTRNLIVHKGENTLYIDQLIEHLHFYYHIIIDLLQETIDENKDIINSLEMAFSLIKIEHEAHMKLLIDLKKEQCNKENFKLLLFGKQT